jgi:hypothetical protein
VNGFPCGILLLLNSTLPQLSPINTSTIIPLHPARYLINSTIVISLKRSHRYKYPRVLSVGSAMFNISLCSS